MSLVSVEFDQSGSIPKYPEWYKGVRNEIIASTKEKRSEYRRILHNHLWKEFGYEPIELNYLREISFILSGSRGGSSIAIDMLRQQAMSFGGNGKKILSLPGEQRPYFELAQFTPPFKESFSDKLNDKDTENLSKTDTLLTELLSEVGYPEAQTQDLMGFAITIYGRFLLQWPNINLGPADEAIFKILEAVKTVSLVSPNSSLYVDNESSRENLLQTIKSQFPEIDLRFYDHLNNQSVSGGNFSSPRYDYFIEEPPFIIPSPWHFASKQELENSVLLLKDPSDAWRIPFWKKVFKNQNIAWLHLTRNVQESVNGLCDGWKFPYGYITTRSPKLLKVKGYTDNLLPWTQWYANFSTSDTVWKLLLGGTEVDLEKIATIQWSDAHKVIIQEVGDKTNRLSFEWLRSNPKLAISTICNNMDVELTPSLLAAADRMKNKKVQVTPGTNADSNRWRVAANYESILTYTTEVDVANLSKELGYNKITNL